MLDDRVDGAIVETSQHGREFSRKAIWQEPAWMLSKEDLLDFGAAAKTCAAALPTELPWPERANAGLAALAFLAGLLAQADAEVSIWAADRAT